MRRVLSVANAFGGGVILSVAVVHILPEVHTLQKTFEDFNNSYKPEEANKYPFPGMLSLCCFAFMLAVEKIITNAHEIEHSHHDEEDEHNENIQSFSSNAPETPQTALMKPHSKPTMDNCITPSILLFALGIHAIFEGIAAGLATNKKSCIQLLLAIGIHKWVEAMALVM